MTFQQWKRAQVIPPNPQPFYVIKNRRQGGFHLNGLIADAKSDALPHPT